MGGRGGDVGHTSQHSETELKKEGEGGTGSGAGDWSPLVHALGTHYTTTPLRALEPLLTHTHTRLCNFKYSHVDVSASHSPVLLLFVCGVGACGGDVVLVDGPCSSLGTLRRGPNVRWEIDSHSLAQYQPLQVEAQHSITHQPLNRKGIDTPLSVYVLCVCSCLSWSRRRGCWCVRVAC